MITTLRNSQGQYFVCYSGKEKFDLRTDKNYMHYDNVDIHIQRNAIVYAINNKIILGIRKCESTKRAKLYKEPTKCRIYSKKKKVQEILPILYWTDKDILEFIEDRKIKLHPLYYKPDGKIDVKKRLGCMGCPLMSAKKKKRFFS